MTESNRRFQALFSEIEIRLDIASLEDIDLFIIEFLDMSEQLSILLRKTIHDSKDQSIVVASTGKFGLFYFWEIGFGLLIIVAQFLLGEKSVIHDIIPITDKIGSNAESGKEFLPDLVTSFSIDVDDFIISDFVFPLGQCMEISQIIIEEI
jgi:hypothetical protein